MRNIESCRWEKEEFERTIEAEEGMCGGADFLLDREMVVQRHLLKSCHHTLIGVHCKNIAAGASSQCVMNMVLNKGRVSYQRSIELE